MAKENSFDIVSQIDFQEVDNAVNQTLREIAVRYDLKNTSSKVILDRKDKLVEVTAPDEFKLKSIIDILQSRLVKRDISLKALKFQKIVPSMSGTVSLKIDLINGISDEESRAITKMIKSSKTKVKVKIEGDRLRVSAQSKDILQQAIGLIKEKDWDIPLQFINYR